MIEKSIEIYYDVADMPDKYLRKPLNFRNAAMERIEKALVEAGLGEWEGAEVGPCEVNFGFSVVDFDSAEVAVRKAVAGTEFEGIREIRRQEIDMDALLAQQEAAISEGAGRKVPAKFRILQIVLPVLLVPVLLVFAVVNGARRVVRR